ncbi:PQQ-dependent sugar dehydrogenase [Persicirhabdus sediminis]|uniref:PQQ-dependent sugar dehydrogenase n=1 Tax=Persicirhabdus sediminis TaxID=454144 RepID=A0A8J7SI84_9BACT|nr:PQQ-dependent sugar dehydrogenase [Persicirhabdus sediminis]MBK1791295.1 PQQ-dependent sugar dehydrogenase [Persicirhabdus sediminis]
MRTLPHLTLALIASVTASLAGPIQLKTLSHKFDKPLWLGSPAGENSKVWVVEKEGMIYSYDLATGQPKLFMDFTSVIDVQANEQGLLGMAFCPDYSSSRRFYLYYTDADHAVKIARFRADASLMTADAATKEELITIDQPYKNHNGGWLEFGPDGFLYAGIGDGGAANDPKDAGQDLKTHLGKILRLDVSVEKSYSIPGDNPFVNDDKALNEIWAYGLRNPWRCTFDAKSGDLYIADVGQNHWEEINYLPAGSAGGANFGWRLREGLIETPNKKAGGKKPAGAIDPIHVYAHGSAAGEGLSITGGCVYRGKIKSLDGHYFFADYVTPHVWSFKVEAGKAAQLKDWSNILKAENGGLRSIASFGQDGQGELYIVTLAGWIHQITEQN